MGQICLFYYGSSGFPVAEVQDVGYVHGGAVGICGILDVADPGAGGGGASYLRELEKPAKGRE